MDNAEFKEADDMKREIRSEKGLPVESKGARSASGDSTGGAAASGPLGPRQRWSAGRKRDVVLRSDSFPAAKAVGFVNSTSDRLKGARQLPKRNSSPRVARDLSPSIQTTPWRVH